MRLAEGRQALLAAFEAVRAAQQAPEETQLRVAREAGGWLGLRRCAAVAVAEGLAVPQQPVQPLERLPDGGPQAFGGRL